MKWILVWVGVLIISLQGNAQIIVNAYARITGITGKTATCQNIDENHDSFAEGEIVMIYQVQDNVLGTTANNSEFGNISSIKSAGLFEFARIESITRSGSNMSVTFEEDLTESYNTNARSRVQLISYPTFIDYTTTDNITAKDWDGNTGGVIAFNVDGTFHINHNIDTDQSGFRGGNLSDDYGGSGNSNVYRTDDEDFAEKGEGIYRIRNSEDNYRRGKAKIINGGGAGNPHNGGGAGGGNFSSGGNGSEGYYNNQTGGIGGLELNSYVTTDKNRLFFGGGGGAGQQNNTLGSKGGNGAGLIFIKANNFEVNNTVTISANGATASNSGNDGAGGGGAGGSIGIITEDFNVSLGNSITFSANGGNGGNVITSSRHGSGGGGGVGTIKFFKANPDDYADVHVETAPGTAGRRRTGDSPYSGGTGTVADGKLHYDSFDGNLGNLLPVELLNQTVICLGYSREISWTTASETNNDYFMLESSSDLTNWEITEIISGAGNSQYELEYNVYDLNSDANYYRLSQTDFDGSREYFELMPANCKDYAKELDFTIHQNSKNLTIEMHSDKTETAYLYDTKGKLVLKKLITDEQISIPIYQLNSGLYIVRIKDKTKKIFIQ